MKRIKLLMSAYLCCAGFGFQAFAQDVETLPEVVVTSANYKYIKSAGDTNTAQPVKMLQRMAATYDIKESDYYEDEYDNYFISFYIPEGTILAVYDQNGKIIRTAEKYKSVALPKDVGKSIAERFPGWVISKNIYVVTYSEKGGGNKTYKLVLENGDKRLRVKTNEKGEFL